MLAAMAAWEWSDSDGTAEQCAGWPSRRWRAASCSRPTRADRFAAIVTLVLADRPGGREPPRTLVADAHRRGSLVSRPAHLWSGSRELRRGELADGRGGAAGGRRRSSGCGARASREDPLSRTRSSPTSCSSAAALEERRAPARADGHATIRGHNTTGWWLSDARVALLTAAGRARRRSAAAGRARPPLRGRPRPGALWWRVAQGRGARPLGRTRRPSRSRARSWRSRARFGAPVRARPDAARAGHARARRRARPAAGGRRGARGLDGAARARQGAGRARRRAAAGAPAGRGARAAAARARARRRVRRGRPRRARRARSSTPPAPGPAATRSAASSR